MSTNVLIVDNDLGFVFWLGQAFQTRGFDSVASSATTEAEVLLAQLNFAPDIVVMRHSLRGCARFAKHLERRYRGLRIIQLVDRGETPEWSSPAVGGCLEKPSTERELESDWLKSLDAVLAPTAGHAAS